MTTLIPFNPAPNANFQFQCTLDGAPYNVICTFNAYGQRYYVNVYDLNGTLVFSRPLIGSPSFANLSLTLGYFDTTMIYRESSRTFEIPGIDPVPLTRPPVPSYNPPGPPPPPPPGPPGVLDAYAAGIVFAFARERLLQSYGGALYRARRASDNFEQDIVAGEDGTDAVALAAFAGSSSAYLVTWYDQSGFGLHLIQATTAKQPKIVNAGTILHNFQPDGIDDCLASVGRTPDEYQGMTFYMAGLPAPIVGTPTPVICGVAGSPKLGLMTYAALTLGNNGLQPLIGNAYGNSLEDASSDHSYALRIDTTKATYFEQAVITAQGSPSWGYHGVTGVPDNDPISRGRLVYAGDISGSTGFSVAQLRAIIGYSVTHDATTALAINAILES